MKPEAEPPEYSMSLTDDLKTFEGLIYWLQAIATDGDCNIERDAIAEVCDTAAKKIESLRASLIQEVDRIEKLQPFFTEVCALVDVARRPNQ